MDIDVSGVKITLTQQQLDQIAAQTRKKGPITQRVTSWSDVLTEAGVKESDILPWKSPKNKAQRSQNAVAKIQLLSQVFNEGWVPDFEDTNQQKWYPWWKKDSSGWSLNNVYCYFWFSFLGFGAYFKSKAIVEHITTHFKDVYLDYLPE